MVSPGLTLSINGPRTEGLISGGLDLVQDSTSSFGDLSFFSQLLVSVKHTITPRLTLYLVDTFVRNDEPSLADQFGLRQQRQTFTRNTLGLSADWYLDLVALQAYYQLATFSSQSSDTVSNVVGVNAGVPLGVLMAVKAGYEFSYSQISGSQSSGDPTAGDVSGQSTGNLMWASFARRIGPAATVGLSSAYALQTLDNARIWNVSLFNTYELPSKFSLSGSVGFSMLTSDAASDTSTVTTDTTASYRLGNAVLTVGLLQDFLPTFTQGENFGVTLTRSYTGGVGYAVTPLVNATVRATYSENQLTGVGDIPGSRNAFTAEASVAWQVRRWLTATLGYNYTQYEGGTVDGGTVSANRVVLKLSGSF